MKKALKAIIGIGILALTLSLFSNFAMAVGPGEDCDETDLLCDLGLICDATSHKCRNAYGTIDCKATADLNKVDAILCRVLRTLSIIFALLLVLAVLYFVWGVVQYVTAGGDEQKSEAGKKVMLYGVIALVVISAVAGIMSIITNYANIDNAIALPFIGG